MACRVSIEKRGRDVYRLHDDASGSSAAILPSFGFNLFDLRLPAAGQVRPLISAVADFADNPMDAMRNGTPILFPFPNRIRQARYRFQGKDYQVPVRMASHGIHGFALDARWDVVDQGVAGPEAYVVGRYQISRNSPNLRASWPTDADLEIRFALSGRRLSMTATVTNPTADDLPYGFGIHPYFRMPFTPDGDLEQTRVIVPASKFWELQELLPTGTVVAVNERLDFRQGQPRARLQLDDVLTGLEFEGERCVCRLVDLALKAEFRLSFDRHFRELVMYTPPQPRGVICLEPYTHTTDAINLQPRGIDAGLRVLRHNQHETMSIVMETVG
jgi:aldose 1-epimerase